MWLCVSSTVAKCGTSGTKDTFHRRASSERTEPTDFFFCPRHHAPNPPWGGRRKKKCCQYSRPHPSTSFWSLCRGVDLAAGWHTDMDAATGNDKVAQASSVSYLASRWVKKKPGFMISQVAVPHCIWMLYFNDLFFRVYIVCPLHPAVRTASPNQNRAYQSWAKNRSNSSVRDVKSVC